MFDHHYLPRLPGSQTWPTLPFSTILLCAALEGAYRNTVATHLILAPTPGHVWETMGVWFQPRKMSLTLLVNEDDEGSYLMIDYSSIIADLKICETERSNNVQAFNGFICHLWGSFLEVRRFMIHSDFSLSPPLVDDSSYPLKSSAELSEHKWFSNIFRPSTQIFDPVSVFHQLACEIRLCIYTFFRFESCHLYLMYIRHWVWRVLRCAMWISTGANDFESVAPLTSIWRWVWCISSCDSLQLQTT